MTLPNYLFLVTIEHGYLLVTPQDIHTILPLDPLVANTVCDWLLCKVEAAGKARYLGFGILLEEDCQVPEFIELLADQIHTFPHQIRDGIKRYETNISSAELVPYIQSNNITQILQDP